VRYRYFFFLKITYIGGTGIGLSVWELKIEINDILNMVAPSGNGLDFEVSLPVTSVRLLASHEQLFLSPELFRIQNIVRKDICSVLYRYLGT
jgi:hypothetical protein